MTRAPGHAWLKYVGLLTLLAVVSLYGMRYGETIAFQLGWIRSSDTGDALFLFGIGAIGCCVAIAGLLLDRAFGRVRRPAEVLGCDSGVVLAELVLILPFLILIAGTIVQLMLILNAAVVVNYAAIAAGRVAVVAYERDGVGVDELPDAQFERDLHETAVLVTATISPASGQGTVLTQAGDDPRNPGQPGDSAEGEGETDPAASMLETVLSGAGNLYGARTVSIRHSYARNFTDVSFTDWVPVSPFEFTTMRNLYPPKEVLVTVDFDFFLSMHGFTFLPGLSEPLPAGQPGRTFPLRASSRVQTAGSRVHSPGAFLGGFPRP